MSKRGLIIAWCWIAVMIFLEVFVTLNPSLTWASRDTIIAILSLSGIAAVAVGYMNVLKEDVSTMLIVLVGLFLAANLILIWTASLVH